MEHVLLVNEIQFPAAPKHILAKPKKVFPFLTKNTAQIKGNFNVVVSDLARAVTNYKLNTRKLDELQFHHIEGSYKLSEFIANTDKVDFPNDAAKVDFIRLIDTYLFKGDRINIVHTYLYNFIDESEKNQSILRNIAEFLKNNIIGNDDQLEEIFKNKQTDHVLMKLIIGEIEHLIVEKEESNKKQTYVDILPEFTLLFKEDLKFLMQHRDYFISNFEIFLNYYTFMYSIQCLLQFERFMRGSSTQIKPLYFALEWESVTKKRICSSSYKRVKEMASNLFVHEYVLQLLSHNIFNKDESGYDVMSYNALLAKIEAHGESYIERFKEDLKILIVTYVEWSEKNEQALGMPNDIKDLLQLLFNLVSERMHVNAKLRFGQSIDYLGQGTFLKSRGNLGNILNMSHDFLILMTSVIVKDKRMSFKTLLEEFEKRGITFDRYSIEEILALFENHNILDKKSDSGDVQYVKPIL